MANEHVLPWRVMTLWQQIDGDVLFTHEPTVITSSDMLNTRPDSALGRFIEYLAKIGINALDIRYFTDKQRSAMASFATYLKSKGIRLLIHHQWTELENGELVWLPLRNEDLHRKSPLLCPFSAKVRQFWKDQVAKDAKEIPDFGGYSFGITTEHFMSNGAPWMCDCDQCSAVTRRERLLEALNYLGGLLTQHGGILVWNNHQDDPWGQHDEIDLFSDLTGHLPDNVVVMFSDLYWDQEPGWPRNPMYDHLKPVTAGRAPYLVRIQLPGQYRGMHLFPSSMVEDWAQTFGDIRRLGLSGVWIQAFVNRTEWDHPWNMAHWEAVGRYVRDPEAEPQQIMIDWATQIYGVDVATTVVKILKLSYPASIKMFMCEGLMATAKSQMASLTYMDSHLCGPFRDAPRVEGQIGLGFPLDMYPPQQAEQIRANPQTRLLFGKEPLTPQVKARAMVEKDEVIDLIDQMIELWESLSSKIDPHDHAAMLKRLRGNRVDARVFKASLDLYFDLKLGVLTNKRIDKVISEFEGHHGEIIPDPSGPPPTARRSSEDEITRNLRSFAEEIRCELHEPWIDDYFKANPLRSGCLLEPPELDA